MLFLQRGLTVLSFFIVGLSTKPLLSHGILIAQQDHPSAQVLELEVYHKKDQTQE